MNELVNLRTEGRIGVVEINSPPVNALSQTVRMGIMQSLQNAIEDDAVEAIVLICSGRTFIAGADIREFGLPPMPPHLPEVVAALEASPKMAVAAIHGTALGGGFEVALGCHYRVARVDAKVGLPEVKLGLLPGAGGTQRLPRLIGVQAALPIMISGDPVAAGKAADLGAIDYVAEGDLLKESIAFTEKLLAEDAPLRRLCDIQIDPDSIPENYYDNFRAANARRMRGYFSPERIISAVQASVEMTFENGMSRERDLFIECMRSSESIALRHVFFAERQAARVAGLAKDTPLRKIESVALIGAGTMGGGIAMNFASRGILVHMVDVDTAAIERGMAVVRSNYMRGVKKGRMSEAQFETLMQLFIPTTDYADLADVDLVIEAVFENMAVKKEIFQRLDKVCKPGAILASNTSSLPITEIAAVTRRPELVIGMHFMNPVPVMKLVEIIRGIATSDACYQAVEELTLKLGKTPVEVNDYPCFISNRILMPMINEAIYCIYEGVADAESIDTVMKLGMAHPMGPLTLADFIGLDTCLAIMEVLYEGFADSKYRPCPLLRKMVKAGWLGKKSGQGFFAY